MILDVEQWNYYHQDSLSSRISAGFQLQAFDSKTSTPQVNDYGIAVGPGTKTRVGVTVHEVSTVLLDKLIRISTARLERLNI